MVSFIIYPKGYSDYPIIPDSWGFVGMLNPSLVQVPEWCQFNTLWFCTAELGMCYLPLRSFYEKYNEQGLYWIYTPVEGAKCLYALPIGEINISIDSWLEERVNEISFLEKCLCLN